MTDNPSLILAWRVIDYWIKNDYEGDRADAIADLCGRNARNAPASLDNLAIRIMNCIDEKDLRQYDDDLIVLSAHIEIAGY